MKGECPSVVHSWLLGGASYQRQCGKGMLYLHVHVPNQAKHWSSSCLARVSGSCANVTQPTTANSGSGQQHQRMNKGKKKQAEWCVSMASKWGCVCRSMCFSRSQFTLQSLTPLHYKFKYLNSGNFRTAYFRTFNFRCSLLFTVSRGCRYLL